MNLIPGPESDGIYAGKFQDLAREIPAGSVDLVWSDPPWSRDLVDLYSLAAARAVHILRDGGHAFFVAGLTHLPQIIQRIMPHLSYYWTIVIDQPNSNAVFNPRRILNKWRPLLWFTKGFEPSRGNRFISDRIFAPRDKRFHDWGHSSYLPIYLLHRLVPQGGLVVDFFTGGGTIPSVCKAAGYRWLAFDVDPTTVLDVRDRLKLQTLRLPLEGELPPPQGKIWTDDELEEMRG